MDPVKSKQELIKAVKEKQPSIVIEGDLANKTIRIQVVGYVAWPVALAAIGFAIYYVVSILDRGKVLAMTSSGESIYSVLSECAIPVAAVIVALTALIAGVAALQRLRNYEFIKKNEQQLILKRRGL